jgi:hypothetical protein
MSCFGTVFLVGTSSDEFVEHLENIGFVSTEGNSKWELAVMLRVADASQRVTIYRNAKGRISAACNGIAPHEVTDGFDGKFTVKLARVV